MKKTWEQLNREAVAALFSEGTEDERMGKVAEICRERDSQKPLIEVIKEKINRAKANEATNQQEK